MNFETWLGFFSLYLSRVSKKTSEFLEFIISIVSDNLDRFRILYIFFLYYFEYDVICFLYQYFVNEITTHKKPYHSLPDKKIEWHKKGFGCRGLAHADWWVLHKSLWIVELGLVLWYSNQTSLNVGNVQKYPKSFYIEFFSVSIIFCWFN